MVNPPAAEPPPPDASPTAIDVDLEGALFRCVSEPVDHAGSHYRFDFAAGDSARLTIDFVPVPQGLQIDEATADTPVRVFEQTMPVEAEGFMGFESDGAWLALDAPFERGLAEAHMGALDSARETLIPEGRDLVATCFERRVDMPARYEPDRGTCAGPDDEPAWNDVPLRFVIATGHGQCARIAGSINGEAFGYPIFRGVDLRGADLGAAELHFASLHEARLEGANLAGFSFGYAIVDGTVDDDTRLPDGSNCEAPTPEGRFRCLQ